MLAGGGKMILGSDSHTRYGALGTMAMGEGGPELVKQLLSQTYDINMPGVVAIYLKGAPRPGVGPQDVALADVEKGVNMFRNESVNKPIFGLVENMAWFTPAEHPDEKYYIFGQGGGLRMAEKYNIPLLGQIPIVQSIREGGDSGEPAALSSRPDGLAFIALAEKLAETLNK
jgi:ATP-binding protein involved in chromosome partitioning